MDLPAAIKEAAAAIARSARDAAPGARWVPTENLHVTLKFLGHVAGERVAEIAGAVGRAAADMVDFDVRLGGLGAFPSQRRARVLWIGLADPAGGFAALSDAVEGSLGRLGFEREQRAFAAHLTIARLKVPAPVALPREPSAFSFRVDRLTLFESHLGRPAPRYEALATFPFRTQG